MQFWQSPDICRLSSSGKLIALYLLTCPHSNILGCFYLPMAYASADIGVSSDDILTGLHECCGIGFCVYDEARHIVWLPKFLDWNPLENPNQWIAARKVAISLPPFAQSIDLIDDFNERLIVSEPKVKEKPIEPIPKPSVTVPKGFRKG